MAKVYKDDKSWFQDFRDQFRSLDGQPFRKKVEHFFTYYSRLTIAILVGLFVIGSLIGTIIYNSRPMLITGAFYPGTISENGDALLKTAVAEKLGVNESKYRSEIASYVVDQESAEQVQAVNQAIIAGIMGKSLDFLVMTKDQFAGLMDKDDPDSCVMADLSDFLPEETYKRLLSEDRILTYETNFSGEIPYLIKVDDSELSDMVELTGKDNYLGIIVNTPRQEAVSALTDLIR